jgi:hypothetical protein
MMLGIGQIQAQVLYGSIVGNVTDPTGAVVVGADVTATQVATNHTMTGKSNESGIYTLSNVPAGAYTIMISKAGFKKSQAQNVNVPFNAVVRVDAQLTIGASKEEVTVNADAAQLQTDRADVNQEISKQELLDVPQPTRTYQGILATVAGVLPPGISAGGTVGTNNVDRSMSIQSNGTSQAATDVRIEGVSAFQPWVPYRSSLTPSVEAIDTVSMVTGSADASQVLSSGATINIQLKSGTNQFHGEAYEYHMDNLWAAKPFFNSGPLAKNIDNNWGFTLGGPILKNKLFFFGSYEYDFTDTALVQNLTVPTPALLTGDFTDNSVACAGTGSSPACTTLYDPTTGNPDGSGKLSFIQEYGSNKIPAGMISNQVKPLLALMSSYAYTPGSPLPSGNGVTAYTSNKQVVISKPQLLQKIDTKFDWDATKKLRITGRYNYHPYSLQAPTSGPFTLFNITTGHSYGNTTAATVAATYLAKQNLVIDGSWGFTRSNEYLVPPYDNVKYGASTLGIPGVNLQDLPAGGGIPNFAFSGFTGLGYNYPYLHYSDPVFSYAGNVTFTHGSNTLKFGVVVDQEHLNHVENSPDNLTFGGNATIVKGGAAASEFNSFADFLLGNPSAWTNNRELFGHSNFRMSQWSAYLTNTQQLGPKLTLSYGTSWAYFPVGTHGSYGPENFNLSSNVYEVCGFGGVSKTCGITSSWALLGPHVGAAYRISPTLVVRAGASIAPEQFNMGAASMYNYPENLSFSASAPNGFVPVGSLSTGPNVLPAPNYQAGVIPLPKGASVITLPQRIKRGYTNSWNLTLEKQLGPWLFQAGYVGNTAVDIHNRYNINYAQLGQGIQSGFMYKYNGSTNTVNAILPYGHTNYNSLQATVQKRFSQGYTIRAAYTWSKWLGLCCDTNGSQALNTPIPQYQRLNYTYMPGDRKGDLAITGTAESPFGKGKQWVKSGPGALILGGWQLNASQIILTGTPFGIGMISSPLFNTPGSTQKADLAAGVTHPKVHPGNINAYYNVSDFAPVNAPRFGTSTYNMLRAPGAANLDASLFRSFDFRERYKLQLRIEDFNVTNTPHFAAPTYSYADTAYQSLEGKILATAPISRVTDSRYFRFGAKLMF